MKLKNFALITLLMTTYLVGSVTAEDANHVNYVLNKKKCPSQDKCDLTNTDKLKGADLQKADLRGADLRGANLQDTNLKGADLRGAKGVDLKGAITDVHTRLPDGTRPKPLESTPE